MNDAYHLTESELAIFHNQEFMPLKAIVWSKIEGLLSLLEQQLNNIIPEYSDWLPDELIHSRGKISRGENYKTYSYRVLDYPRIFKGEDIFTFRCVALWGHPIGFHLILKGKYKKIYQEKILINALNIKKEGWLSDQDDPWIWEHEPDNQVLINKQNKNRIKTINQSKSFLRISAYLPLTSYLAIPSVGNSLFTQWVKN